MTDAGENDSGLDPNVDPEMTRTGVNGRVKDKKREREREQKYHAHKSEKNTEIHLKK